MEENLLARLEARFTAMRTLRVGVIGDPGSPLLEGAGGEYHPGACGAAAGLAALGLADVQLFTIADTGERGDTLLASLQGRGIGAAGVIQPASGQADNSEELLRRLETALPRLDAMVIIDDRPAGVITTPVLDALNDFALFAPAMNFVVRSHERIGRYNNMIRMPDQREAVRWLFPKRRPEQVKLEEFAAAALHPQVDCGCALVILLGRRGSLVMENGESHMVRTPVEYVDEGEGAADAFLSTFTAALSAGSLAVESVSFAHLAAAASARVPGGIPAPGDVLALAAEIRAR